MTLQAEISIMNEKLASQAIKQYSSYRTTQDVSININSRNTKGTLMMECESIRNSTDMIESKYMKGFDSITYRTVDPLPEEAFVEVVD